VEDVRQDGDWVRCVRPLPAPPTNPPIRAVDADSPRSGAVLAIGGPLFTMWLTPTEEELFLRYNPELQKRSLENRQQKQQDFDDFVTRLKVYSKSDKPSMFTLAPVCARP